MSAANTWDDHAQTHVERIGIMGEMIQPASVGDLRSYMDSIIETFFDREHMMDDDSVWLQLGAFAYKNDNEYKFDVDSVTEILINKQRDYGPDNIARFGLKGLIVRVHDKVARLENLTENNREASNESIEDTYLDIIGYSAIGMMWMNDQFLSPLKQKVNDVA